jgi:hypothetical protein
MPQALRLLRLRTTAPAKPSPASSKAELPVSGSGSTVVAMPEANRPMRKAAPQFAVAQPPKK